MKKCAQCDKTRARLDALKAAGREFLTVTGGIADVELWRAEKAFRAALNGRKNTQSGEVDRG